MKRPRQHVLADESRRALEDALPTEWTVRPIQPDYGLDVEVTIVEDEDVTSNVFKAQLKATDQPVDTSGEVSLSIQCKHLKDYENYPQPVFILYYIRLKNLFYYVFAQKYVKEDLSMDTPAWRTQKSATVRFSSDSTLKNIGIFKSAVVDSLLYVAQSQLNLRPGGAIYTLDGIPRSDDQELKRLTLVALSCSKADKYQLAIDKFEYMLRVCTVSPSEKMALLLSLGNCYLAINQYENALRSYAAANDVTSKVSDSDASASQGKAIALNGIGLVYAGKGQRGDALKYLQKGLRVFRRISYREAEASSLNNIGTVYRIQGEVKKAMARYRLALRIHKETANRGGQAAVMGNIGNVYQMKNRLPKALKYYREALEIHREVGYRQGEAENLGSIGVVYGRERESKEAIAHLRMALRIFIDIGNREGEATTLGCIGTVYSLKGQVGKSMKYQQLALKINRQIGNKEGEAINLGNMGDLYLDEDNVDEALRHFRLALEIFEEIGNAPHVKWTKQRITDIESRVDVDRLVDGSRVFIFFREK